MELSDEVIRASYADCRSFARRSKSSFYWCFLRLPQAKRRAMDALYAFMRHTDDLADDPVPVAGRREALRAWRTALDQALSGHFDLPAQTTNSPQRPANLTESPTRRLLPAVADTVRRYRIPAEYLRAVIDGVEMDLDLRRYETFEELVEYCERVASAVGWACIHVWGFRGRQALQRARNCGIALQLTNILRDLSQDARQDRVYLPLEDLRRCGYSVDDLMQGAADERFEQLMAFQIARAERFYRDGAELMQWLEPDGKPVFGMMTSIYHALLAKIRRRPSAVLRGVIHLSRATKLRIAARWTFLPARIAAL